MAASASSCATRADGPRLPEQRHRHRLELHEDPVGARDLVRVVNADQPQVFADARRHVLLDAVERIAELDHRENEDG